MLVSRDEMKKEKYRIVYMVSYKDKTCDEESFEYKTIIFTTLKECYGFISSHLKDNNFMLINKVSQYEVMGDYFGYTKVYEYAPLKLFSNRIVDLVWHRDRARYKEEHKND